MMHGTTNISQSSGSRNQGSSPHLLKSATGHDPEPVSSTSHPHNIFPSNPL